MKYQFLYNRFTNKVGVLDDSENSEDSLWFMSAEYDQLIEEMTTTPTGIFIHNFIQLFGSKIPNGARLSGVFSDKIERKNEAKMVVNPCRKDLEKITFVLKNDSDYQVIKDAIMLFKVNVQNSLSEIKGFKRTVSEQKVVYKNIAGNNLITHIQADLSLNELTFSI